jgi:hypothetical protein
MPYETALCSLQRGVLHESTIYLEHAKGELDRLHALADAEEASVELSRIDGFLPGAAESSVKMKSGTGVPMRRASLGATIMRKMRIGSVPAGVSLAGSGGGSSTQHGADGGRPASDGTRTADVELRPERARAISLSDGDVGPVLAPAGSPESLRAMSADGTAASMPQHTMASPIETPPAAALEGNFFTRMLCPPQAGTPAATILHQPKPASGGSSGRLSRGDPELNA